MPGMTNGIGTWFCKAHFEAGWGWDDAVECAMFLYFPVWAHRVVHMRDVPGGSFAQDRYQAFPLRYSEELVTHVFLRRWSAGFVGVGIFVAFMLGLVTLLPPTGNSAREWAVAKPILTPIAPCLIVAGLAGLLYVRPRIARERDIRRILGLHDLGSSDPATWVGEDMARIPKAEARFGTATYAEAVPKLLAAGSWTGAMWAARLAAARESSDLGQRLTDEVLRHPGTSEALARFRRDATCWSEAMAAQAADSLGRSPPDRTI